MPFLKCLIAAFELVYIAFEAWLVLFVWLLVTGGSPLREMSMKGSLQHATQMPPDERKDA
jgi:hypothetical protein